MNIPQEVAALMETMGLRSIQLLADALRDSGPFDTVRIEKQRGHPRRIVVEPSILLPPPDYPTAGDL